MLKFSSGGREKKQVYGWRDGGRKGSRTVVFCALGFLTERDFLWFAHNVSRLRPVRVSEPPTFASNKCRTKCRHLQICLARIGFEPVLPAGIFY